MKNNIIIQKSEDFSVRIINLYKFLAYDKKEFVIAKQILRSGTSIGANIVEAQNASSARDFIAKLEISLKEQGETAYWLRLLKRTDFLTKTQFDALNRDSDELGRLLTSIIKTKKSKK
jgi:four helix bundle protein